MTEILKAHVDDPLELLEQAPEDVVAGDPQTRSKLLLHVPGDMSGGFSGIFSSQPGSVRSALAAPESFYIVEGRAYADNGTGDRVELDAGDVVVLPPGDWTWTFETAFRAVFVAGPAPAADHG